MKIYVYIYTIYIYWDLDILLNWIDHLFHVDSDVCWTFFVNNKLGMGIPTSDGLISGIGMSFFSNLPRLLSQMTFMKWEDPYHTTNEL